MNKIKVDFSTRVGKIKPVHSVCCAPYSFSAGAEQKRIYDFFTEGNIPYCRLHDCCGAYGGMFFVDVPNVFPNFDADENNPENYDFYYTDEYINAIQRSGCEAYYRLGITIEWASQKRRTAPPKDFSKWARICEHIIMHYNEGWANGYHYDLKYWEIWNEPENPKENGYPMWAGTKEEFFDLYKISSKHLKTRFPNIKIGGYASCGFYAVTRENIPAFFTDFVTWFTDFLKFVKAENCPLDFFSWHIYGDSVEELIAHAKFARETLDQYGFTDTENHLNEWNYGVEGGGFTEKHTLVGASFNGAVLSQLQNTNYVDMAHYYCFSGAARYNGFLDQNDGHTCPSWYPFVAFGKMYALGSAAQVNTEGAVYGTAAVSENESALLLSNYSDNTQKVELDLQGVVGKTAHVLHIDEQGNLEERESFTVYDKAEITLTLPAHSLIYIEIR